MPATGTLSSHNQRLRPLRWQYIDSIPNTIGRGETPAYWLFHGCWQVARVMKTGSMSCDRGGTYFTTPQVPLTSAADLYERFNCHSFGVVWRGGQGLQILSKDLRSWFTLEPLAALAKKWGMEVHPFRPTVPADYGAYPAEHEPWWKCCLPGVA